MSPRCSSGDLGAPDRPPPDPCADPARRDQADSTAGPTTDLLPPRPAPHPPQPSDEPFVIPSAAGAGVDRRPAGYQAQPEPATPQPPPRDQAARNVLPDEETHQRGIRHGPNFAATIHARPP